MRLNKTVMACALATAFLSGCSSTDEKYAELSNGGQTGVIDASVSGYNNDPNSVYSDNAIIYDASLQGTDNPNDDIAIVNKVDTGQTDITNSSGSINITDSTGTLNFPVSKDTVYFMYDSSRIRPEFMPIIEAYSQHLLAHPEQIVILEGHADQRGSREYNIALGEERAKAVAKLIVAKGIFSGQLEAVSYGEEKPATNKHDESNWHLDRRVKLIYQRTSK